MSNSSSKQKNAPSLPFRRAWACIRSPTARPRCGGACMGQGKLQGQCCPVRKSRFRRGTCVGVARIPSQEKDITALCYPAHIMGSRVQASGSKACSRLLAFLKVLLPERKSNTNTTTTTATTTSTTTTTVATTTTTTTNNNHNNKNC